MRYLKVSMFILCCALMSSCVKNYYYDCDGNGTDTGGGTTGVEYPVRFTANVNQESDAILRAASATPLQANRYVTVYSFLYKEDYLQELTDYQTLKSGILSPVTGKGLYLVEGNYEFYALSIGNKNIYPPTVFDYHTGTVGELQNGIDYLADVIQLEKITQPTNIALTFNHMASQVMVIVESGSSTLTIDSIADATISAPLASTSEIYLFTGTISPSKSLADSPITMAVNDSLCQQILLPLNYDGTLTMKFSAYINGRNVPRNFTVDVPLVNNQLKGGSSYKYKVLLDDYNANIATATVNPWTEVDETGKPLTPNI